MLRLPRTSFGLLFLILVVIVGGIDFLTLPKAKPPAELIGRWRGPQRTLEVEANGNVTFWSRAGKVTTETGGHFMRLANDTLTYRVFFFPTRLHMDRGPAEDSTGWAVWVEGEELRREAE